MFDDITTYYHEAVVAPFADYRDTSKDGLAGRSRDIRSALIAASALFHLREHLPGPTALSRAALERLCPDYALLGDVVNASKHKSLSSNTPHGAPFVPDAANLGENLIITEYEDEVGTYRYVQKTVIVKLTDGSERDLLEVLTNVINYWEQHMFSLGILSSARTFVYDNGISARSRAECESNRLDFELVQGHRFHQTIRLLRFNKETGKAEPIDLTGSKIQLNVYKRPQISIDLSLTHNISGKEYKKTITLTEDESEKLALISDDVERQKYVNDLPVTQAALRELTIEASLAKDEEPEIGAHKLEKDA